MDHLACMTTFAAVVEKGGFAAAARYLSVTPASVTRHVFTLEQRIGARLLQRTTRKCSLTEAGQVFYERGVKILEDVREADAVASEFHATSRGTVRVQTSPTLSNDVGRLIAAYAAIRPEISFDLTTTNQMGDLIGERIDLALRDDLVPESSLIVRRLAFVEWTPCASLDHVARRGLPVHPTELTNHNCLVYMRGHDCDEWRFTSGNRGDTVRVFGTLRSTDPNALHAAALAGQGVVLLPAAMVAEDLRAGRLVRVLSAYTAEPASLRAVYPSRQRLTVKVRAFLDFAAITFTCWPRIELCARPPTPRRTSDDEGGRLMAPGPTGSPANRGPIVSGTLNGQSAVLHAAAAL